MRMQREIVEIVLGLLLIVGCGGEGASPGTTGAAIPGPPYNLDDILSVAPACADKYADVYARTSISGGGGSRIPCGLTGTGFDAVRSSPKVYKYDLLCAKCAYGPIGQDKTDESGCLAPGDTGPYYCAASCGECGPPSKYVQP